MTLEERYDALSKGARPTNADVELALSLDTTGKLDLAEPLNLAIAMHVSSLLCDEPNYRAAVKAANDDERPEVDEVSERVVAGEPVSRAEIDAAYAAVQRRHARRLALVVTVAKRYMLMRFLPATRVERVHPRTHGARPRARRTHAQSRSSSRGGDPGGDDGPGEPEPSGEAAAGPLARLWRPLRCWLARRHRSQDQIRWCERCGVQAFAQDDYQRARLDEIGFRDGLCPDCRRAVER